MSRGRIALLASLLFAGLVALVGTQDQTQQGGGDQDRAARGRSLHAPGDGRQYRPVGRGRRRLSGGRPVCAAHRQDPGRGQEVSDKPVRFVVNTHWHGDHTGGNETSAKAGVLIVAHDNVRKRMSAEQFIAAFNCRSRLAQGGAPPS